MYKINYTNSKKINKPISVIATKLTADLQFHEMLKKTDNLKISCDIDKLRVYKPSRTLENVIMNICEFFQINESDVSYTTNFSVDTGSHHLVIPKYYMNSCDQKNLWIQFKTRYEYGNEIDANIFGKDGWFRLPNQTKESVSGTEHIIQRGDITDFVLKYIENAELFVYEPPVDNNTTDEDLWSGEADDLASNCSSITIDITIPKTDDKYIELLFNVIGNDKSKIDWDIWFQIAGCLKSNEYDKSLFLKYSEPNDIQQTASSVWDGIKKSTMNIHTLQSIAKRINFPKYKQWLNTHEKCLYEQFFTTGLIADYFKLLYGDKFIQVDDIVYMFNGVFWEKCSKKNNELVNFVDKVFVVDLLEYANDHMVKNTALLSTSQNPEIIKSKLEKITDFLVNINKMRNASFRKPILEDIVSFITNNNIEFDSNPYLFAFTNAVFDLKLFKFVDADPTFYITKTAGYPYNSNYSTDKIKLLDDLISTIFPDPAVKNYYLSMLSTGLCGLQIENCFIATGTGGNGKSLINSLMMQTCGQYAYKLPSNVLLSEIKSGPNPEVANMNNVRFLLTQEPNSKKKICCATLKEITGDKTLNVRELYSSKCSITLRNTTVIESNEIPAVDEVNDAIFRRLRTIPFGSRYVEQSVYDTLEDRTNVFVANFYYKTDEFQNDYKQALFELLKIQFKTFVENNHSLPTLPKCCLDKCASFLGTCDDVFGWFETFYEKTETIESSEPIPLKEIYSRFSTSTFFDNMSKSDKRKYNKKYFLEKLEGNIFLRKYVKLRGSYHNKSRQPTDYMVGWKMIDMFENVVDNE